MKEAFIETTQGRISYWKGEGSSDLPVLVFLHGLSSNHTTWDPIVDMVKNEGYPTIALDLRGHGLSDKTRRRGLYTVASMCRDLEELLKAEGITRFVLVGYSYGAYIVLEYLRAHPSSAEAAVLISTNYVSPFRYHWFSFLSPVAYFCINVFGWLLFWQKRKKYYYFDPTAAPGYWKSTFAGYATMPLSINFWMLSEVFRLNEREGLEQVTSPTLIIRGENDAFISEKETNDLASFLRAKVVTLGLGHYVASHYQELCAKEILGFLKQENNNQP